MTDLDGLDPSVPQGMVLGLLGSQRCPEGDRRAHPDHAPEPDDGTAEVAGIDVLREPQAVRDASASRGSTPPSTSIGYESLETIGGLPPSRAPAFEAPRVTGALRPDRCG